ncbi:hypothetical protein V1514DRAFT_365904 [Lipomyces japonicus]|uniref:uncharacterized protein n=1 Tax=Lipomyces japonicus TaxID=56871 RepID=UPI0034CD4BDC
MVSFSQVLKEAEEAAFLPNLRPVGLFGDSIKTVIPEGFVDASDFRQIPDNQEVFVSAEGSSTTSDDNSIIIELVERLETNEQATQSTIEEDQKAVIEHYEEISSLNSAISRSKQFGVAPLKTPNLPQSVTSYLSTGVQIAQKWGKDSEATYLVLTFAVIRIPEHGTDILISFNSASKVGQDGLWKFEESDDLEPGVVKRIGELQAIARQTVKELKVENWGLFAD